MNYGSVSDTTFRIGSTTRHVGILSLLLVLSAGCGSVTSSHPKLAALQTLSKHLKQFPDKFAPDSEREVYNKELGRLVNKFTETPFSAKEDPATAKQLVELFEESIDGRFTGYYYNIIDGHVKNLYMDLLNR